VILLQINHNQIPLEITKKLLIFTPCFKTDLLLFMKKLIILYSVLLSLVTQLYAQETWKSYTTENSGLVNNYINSIEQDLKGNIWVSTSYGVSKFDGTNWTNYNTTNSGLASSWVKSITTDVTGNLWVGTDKGVSKFNGSTWTTYNTSNSGLSDNYVESITSDAAGNVWFGVNIYGGILCKFDGIKWSQYTPPNFGSIKNYIKAIEISSNGYVWIGTLEGGRLKFDGVSWENYGVGEINSLHEDLEGNLWIGSYGSVIKSGTTGTAYTTSNSGLTDNFVNSITTDAAGNVWIGTNGGVSKFDGTNWTTYNKSNSGLVDNTVHSITTDATGNVWFGTSGGVSVLQNAFEIPKNLKRVTGKIYFDKNQNKQKEINESYLANQKVRIQPNNRIAFTNSLGEYSFVGDSGVNYTVSYLPKNFYSATKDTSFTFTLKQDLQLADFGVYAKDTTIFTSNIALGNGRCNSEITNIYSYTNAGTTSPNSRVILTLDKDVKIKSSYPAYDSLVANKVYFTLKDFLDGSQRQIKLNVINPEFTRMGDTLVYESSFAANGRTFNSKSKQIVTCSYDPNDKTVSPLPIGEDKFTLKKEPLTYTIRFQNTGNDTAFYVAIKDTLDPSLDYNTFEVVGSSHKVNTTMESNGLVTFAFNGIVLPDSTTNEKESHGFVSYTIQVKSDIAENTVVKNTAYIYFDQNPAVITNTTENRIVTTIPRPLAIESISTPTTNQVVPQPIINQSELRFENKGDKVLLQVLDLSGKVIFQKQTQGKIFELNKNEFPHAGIYIYQLQSTSNTQTGKLVVE